MNWDVVGLGNAIMDAVVQIESDGLLSEVGLIRGTMHPVDNTGWLEVFERVKHLDHALESGGSCANTISTLGRLGAHVTYRGQVGDDSLGSIYADRLTDSCGGHHLVVKPGGATGKCLSVVSKADAERTMITDLGAAVELGTLDGYDGILGATKIGHFEGYTLLDGPTVTIAERAMGIVQEAGGIVSLDASDPFVIHAQKERFWDFLERYVDIVFLNAEEARALTDHDPEHAAAVVAERAGVSVVVVKLGGSGSIVYHDGRAWRIPVERVPAIDTTGAGDAYAGGFLFGWLNGWGAERSGKLASAVAAATVSQMGAVVKDNARLRAIIERIQA